MSSTSINSDVLARYLLFVPLAVVLLLMLLLDVAIASVMRIQSDEAAGIVIGSAFAQIAGSAVLISLGPMRLFPRLMTGILTMVLACLSMFACAYRDAGDQGLALVILGTMFVQWLIYQAPLWGARYSGWQICMPHTLGKADSTRGETQFGIRQVMIWTAIVAVFLAAGRLLFGSLGFSLGGLDTEDLALFAIISLCNCLVALPIIWGCLVRRRVWLWLIFIAGWSLLITIIEMVLLAAASGMRGGREMFVILNITQVVAVTVVLLCVRIAGFRLHRR